jgi:hypothetical protein
MKILAIGSNKILEALLEEQVESTSLFKITEQIAPHWLRFSRQ